MSVLHQDSGWIGKSIPSALEISLGHGFCTPRPREISQDFPRPSRNLGRRGWISQSIPCLGGARIQCKNFILGGNKATNANASDWGPDFLQLEEGEELDWGKREMGGEIILL